MEPLIDTVVSLPPHRLPCFRFCRTQGGLTVRDFSSDGRAPAPKFIGYSNLFALLFCPFPLRRVKPSIVKRAACCGTGVMVPSLCGNLHLFAAAWDQFAFWCAGQIFSMTFQNPNTISTHEETNVQSANAHAPEQHTSDHLANERTFLAWIRTSISVIGLGFVVAKFSVWLRELSARMDHATPAHHSGLSMPLGIALMSFGALLAFTAAWRYRSVKEAILENRASAAEGTTIAVAVIVACIAIALVAYMLASA